MVIYITQVYDMMLYDVVIRQTKTQYLKSIYTYTHINWLKIADNLGCIRSLFKLVKSKGGLFPQNITPNGELQDTKSCRSCRSLGRCPVGTGSCPPGLFGSPAKHVPREDTNDTMRWTEQINGQFFQCYFIWKETTFCSCIPDFEIDVIDLHLPETRTGGGQMGVRSAPRVILKTRFTTRLIFEVLGVRLAAWLLWLLRSGVVQHLSYCIIYHFSIHLSSSKLYVTKSSMCRSFFRKRLIFCNILP